MKVIRLPQTKKEGLLYGFIICIITVTLMLLINISIAKQTLDLEVIMIVLKLIPIIFIITFLLENLIVGKIVRNLVDKFTNKNDSFNTKILFNILFCVTIMSMSMTIIGGTIGNGRLSIEPFTTFFEHWPRNFCAAFWIELLLAQPLARYAMNKVHLTK